MYALSRVKIKKSAVWAIPIMVFSFMGGYSFFAGDVGSLQWYLFYYGRFLLLMAYALYSYSRYVTKADKLASRWMLRVFITPEVIMLGYSILLWILHRAALPYITRGISDTGFIIGAFFAGISMAKVMRTDVFRYGLYSAFITLVLSTVLGISKLGLAFFTTAAAGDNIYLELSEAMFTVGLYVICLLFTHKKFSKKNSLFLAFLAIVYFMIGNKRIGILGLILAAVFGLLTVKLPKRIKVVIMGLTGYAAIVIAFLYVYLAIAGKLSGVFDRLGIDMNGRDILYNYFKNFCEFKVTFPGRGVGFVGRQFSYTTAAELYNMAVTKALHNDFLKYFIELGFWGLFAWLWYWIRFLPKYLIKKIGVESAFVCFILIVYSFITYATDNTAGYLNYQMHLSMLIAATASGYLNKTQSH